jgi:hypothetical protein
MNDNELIYLVKTENLANAKDYLDEKYLNFVNNHQRKIYLHATNRSLESDDITISFSYITLQKCIQEFDFKSKKYAFGQLVSLNSKGLLYNEMNRVYNHRKHFVESDLSNENTLIKNHENLSVCHINTQLPEFVNKYLEKEFPYFTKLKNLLQLKCLG